MTIPSPTNLLAVLDLETIIEEATSAQFTAAGVYVSKSDSVDNPDATPVAEGEEQPQKDFNEVRPRVDVFAAIGESEEQFAPPGSVSNRRVPAAYSFALRVSLVTNSTPREATKEYRALVRHIVTNLRFEANALPYHLITTLIVGGTDREVRDQDGVEVTTFNLTGKIRIHPSAWTLLNT